MNLIYPAVAVFTALIDASYERPEEQPVGFNLDIEINKGKGLGKAKITLDDIKNHVKAHGHIYTKLGNKVYLKRNKLYVHIITVSPATTFKAKASKKAYKELFATLLLQAQRRLHLSEDWSLADLAMYSDINIADDAWEPIVAALKTQRTGLLPFSFDNKMRPLVVVKPLVADK